MYQRVQSSIILKSDMENILRATWEAHNGLAAAIPVREVQIYRAGFQAALAAVGVATGVKCHSPSLATAMVDWEENL